MAELKITEEEIVELRKRGLAVCLPAYGGKVDLPCMQSILGLQQLFMQLGIPLEFHFQMNESLISRARAYLADSYLRSNEMFSHMLFIDSDIQFDPKEILYMFHLDKEVCGLAYPLKTIKWDNIEKGIRKHGVNTFKSSDYNKVIGSFVFNLVEGTSQLKIDEPVEVKYIGTGMMMIKRETFGKFKEAYPQYSYLPDHRGTEHFGGEREIVMYFPCEIDPVSKRYLSEDYLFCELCRKIGIQIWCLPWANTTHWGTFGYQGNMQAIAQIVQELS